MKKGKGMTHNSFKIRKLADERTKRMHDNDEVRVFLFFLLSLYYQFNK